MQRNKGNFKGYVYMICLTLIFLSSCADRGGGEDGVIRVNDAHISLEEFNTRLKAAVRMDPDLDLSEESREGFIGFLVQQELMVQEAVRMGLDREAAFVKTIERHWQATLIRNLLARKTEELSRTIVVTREEAKAYYDRHRDRYPQPFEQLRDQISKQMERNKLEGAVDQWVEGLNRAAHIRVDRDQIRSTTGSG